ncbi:MAG: hypothetical protein DRI44_09425 [Chlamydiae bacterium]|nr:MAG: hypothetical protein DRI44_09425 [Chlamydiota bacterium]
MYHSALSFGFLDWDDMTYVIDYPNLGNVGYFWSSFSNGYIPITYTWWSLTLDVFGKNAAAFHYLNILFHILTTLVVYFLLKSLLKYFYRFQKEILEKCGMFALMGALLFAVHPLQVESVCWITSLKDVSAGFFSCLALFYFVQFRLKNKKSFYSLGLISFLFAMLSKPTAVSVLLMILIIDFLLFKKNVRNTIVSLVPWMIIALPILALNAYSQEKLISLYQAPWFTRPIIALDAMSFYLYKLFLPINILPDYGRSPFNLIGGGLIYWTWIPVSILIAASLIFVRCTRLTNSSIHQSTDSPIHKFIFLISGLFLFIAGILPVSGLIPFAAQNNSTVYDRYVYLSMLGTALVFCFVLAEIKKNRKTALIIGCVLLAALSWRSMAQSQIWENDFQLWNYTLVNKKNSVVAMINLGRQFSAKGDITNAFRLYQKAVEIAPYDPDAHNNLGSILARKGNFNSAELHFREAVRLNPKLQTAHENLMRIYMLRHDWINARHCIRTLLKLNPRHVGANLNQAEIYLHTQQFEKCINHLNEINRWLKNNSDLENFLGVAYAGLGNKVTAQMHFRKALELNPKNKSAKQNLSKSVLDMQK